MAKIFDFNLQDKSGKEVSLELYKGKVLLVVNTATGCGFTPQYEELEAMYERLKDKGLEILDVPCNQFGHQAPGSDAEIGEFCTLKFGASFPQFKKSDVNGANELPLYTWLKQQKPYAAMPTKRSWLLSWRTFITRLTANRARKTTFNGTSPSLLLTVMAM